MGTGIKTFFGLLLLVVVVLVFGFAAGWLSLPFDLFGRPNVQAQWTWAYDQYESLQATAQQICTAEGAVQSAQTESERTQRTTQLIAYEQNYARLAADYDARMRNAFEAGLVAPPDVPRRAPTLADMKAGVCG